jgi:acyl-CoA reductase-like NAD-dependent aldehyde dehydrogenase
MSTTSISAHPLAERVERCRRQQETWRQLPIRARVRHVRGFRRLLVTECDRLCAAVVRDVGKTTEETLGGDILPLADACRFLEREAGRLLRPRRVSLRQRPLVLVGQRDTVHRRPRGVIGIIGTWNYPLLLNGVQIVQALTAGNGVLWKPSEVAPASAEALHGLLLRAGFPGDLVQLLDATREAGRELAESEVDHVVFTGSSTTGAALAAILGRRLVSSSLELSGCDAMFVLDDADVALAARAAWFGATVNRGQTCLAVRRAFVQRSLHSAFIETLRPLAAAATPQRQALESQVQQADRLVKDALAEGGRLLDAGCLGSAEDPRLCSPVVVLDAHPEMDLCREASFAPVMAVLPFDTVEDAVRMDRSCPYALAASIFSAKPERAALLAAQLRVGMVAINDVILPTVHPGTPFGGTGQSGWGVTQGAEGLLETTVPQVVSVRGGSYRPHYDASGGMTPSHGDLLRGLLALGHGTTLRQRMAGLWRTARAMWHGS